MGNKLYVLSLKKDFENLFEKGQLFKGKRAFLRIKKTPLQKIRIAHGLSRKNFSKAVQRNQIKRWSKEYLRKTPLLRGQSADLQITFKGAVKNYEQTKKILEELLSRAFRKAP